MTHAAKPPLTNIIVAGDGPDADAWARALRGIDGVEIQRLTGASEDELLEGLSRDDIHAVALVPPALDLPGVIKRAVMTGRHVLVAGAVALSSKQLLALADLAHRRQRVILFDDGSLADERLAFVRKMTGGPHALWRPRYIRSLRTGVHGRATLDDLAVADIGVALSIAGGMPSLVSGLAPRADDESGSADVAMVTMSFDGGLAARVDVSFVEPALRQEIVIACDGRSVVLDALDSRAPLRIDASARHRGPKREGQWAETVSEHPLGDTGDRLPRAAETFVGAVRAGAFEATNAHALASAALVWETARASMTRDGEALPLAPASPLARANRPALQLIEGGGHRVESSVVPELTLVSRREPA